MSEQRHPGPAAGPQRSLAYYGTYALFHGMIIALLYWRGRVAWQVFALVVLQFAALTAFESWLPLRRDWKERQRSGLALDVGLPLVYALSKPLVSLIPFLGLTASFTRLPPAAFATPVRHLPFVVQCALAVLLSDLAAYWYHRLMHTTALWPMHAVHHQIEGLSTLRALRVHPVEETILLALSTLLPLVAGFDHEAVAFAIRNSFIVAMLQHSNIAFGGPGGLLPTAVSHARHHAADLPFGNYGIITTLWDRVFGTWRPTSHEEMATVRLGLAHDDLPRTVLGQLLYPFGPLLPARWSQRAAGLPEAGES